MLRLPFLLVALIACDGAAPIPPPTSQPTPAPDRASELLRVTTAMTDPARTPLAGFTLTRSCADEGAAWHLGETRIDAAGRVEVNGSAEPAWTPLGTVEPAVLTRLGRMFASPAFAAAVAEARPREPGGEGSTCTVTVVEASGSTRTIGVGHTWVPSEPVALVLDVVAAEIGTVADLATATPAAGFVFEQACEMHGTALTGTGLRVDTVAGTITRVTDHQPGPTAPLAAEEVHRLARLIGHPRFTSWIAETPVEPAAHPGMTVCVVAVGIGDDRRELRWQQGATFSPEGEVWRRRVVDEARRLRELGP